MRLVQGDFDQEQVYDNHPETVAKRWLTVGAQRLHFVDLDAAQTGAPANLHVLERLERRGDIPIQWGGGLRTRDAVDQVVAAGVSHPIVGTVAVSDRETFASMVDAHPDCILVSLDVRGDQVALSGWEEQTELRLEDVAKDLSQLAIAGFIVTSIARDGTLSGIDPTPALQVADATGMSAIIAGGVATLADVEEAWSRRERGVRGVILGKALYEGTLDLYEALKVTGELA